MSESDIGEIWYVKLFGSGCLHKVKITDMTDKTVELADPQASTWYYPKSSHHRYAREDVIFVELESGQ